MRKLWKKYYNHLIKTGEKIIASIVNADTPKIKGNNIHLVFPSPLMKEQLERAKGPLLKHLRENLNNYKINLVIDVNEEVTKKFAYTPQEKFLKLRDKNPAIDLLKNIFDLDL